MTSQITVDNMFLFETSLVIAMFPETFSSRASEWLMFSSHLFDHRSTMEQDPIKLEEDMQHIYLWKYHLFDDIGTMEQDPKQPEKGWRQTGYFKKIKASSETEYAQIAGCSKTDDALVSNAGEKRIMTRPKHIITSGRKKRRKVSTKTEVSKYAKISRTDDASDLFMDESWPRTRSKSKTKYDKEHDPSQPEEGQRHDVLLKVS
ncbi:hypothetical protein MAR_020757 [Mya arenaria]|uniref:Uncharacterized protein n=1 Tax=Mya arenaria TaxID=6604 RepID=A0ABY7E5S2_MYAAR|nr:hypothetical protein MAR_020757 [Mya arenaria]